MKRTLLVVALVGILMPGLMFAQAAAKPASPGAQSAEQAVTALENAWLQVIVTHDAAWYEKNLAPGFISTDDEGAVRDKAETIARAKQKAYNGTATSDELKVKAYGDTVIATGIEVDKGTTNGKDTSGRFRWTDTWIKVNGQWQCVASHSSKITAK